MESETLVIAENRSKDAKQGGLIISSTDLRGYSGMIDLVVGRIGFPSTSKSMRVGDALLFETPDSGLFEIRISNIVDRNPFDGGAFATVLITRLSPQPGLTGGFVEQDASNSRFAPGEISRIAKSLEDVRTAVSQRHDLKPEQIEFVSKKLDEMVAAADRMGRRDWMNLAIGVLTNIVVSVAFNRDAARFLFETTGQALSWLVGQGMKLLP